MAFGADSLWVAGEGGKVARIDPATNQVVTTIPTQPTAGFVAFGAGSLWVTNPGTTGAGDGKVTRIDPTTNEVVTTVNVGDDPETVVLAGGSVWVGLSNGRSVVRLNPTTAAVVGRVPLDGMVYALTATDHAVWLTNSFKATESDPVPPPGLLIRITY
jgi:streptogramin lyase